MPDGVPQETIAAINADANHRVGNEAPTDATWTHQHSGAITLTYLDPHQDVRAARFREQQRLRNAQLALSQLRWTEAGGASEEEKAAVLKSLQPILKASGLTEVMTRANQPESFAEDLRMLSEEWIPHLVAKEAQAENELLTSIYGTASNPREDPLMGQLTNAMYADWRLKAVRAELEGHPEEAYQARMTLAKWHNDREARLRQEQQASVDPRRKKILEDAIAQEFDIRQQLRTEASRAAERAELADSLADAAMQAGKQYGAEMRRAIQAIVQDSLRRMF